VLLSAHTTVSFSTHAPRRLSTRHPSASDVFRLRPDVAATEPPAVPRDRVRRHRSVRVPSHARGHHLHRRRAVRVDRGECVERDEESEQELGRRARGHGARLRAKGEISSRLICFDDETTVSRVGLHRERCVLLDAYAVGSSITYHNTIYIHVLARSRARRRRRRRRVLYASIRCGDRPDPTPLVTVERRSPWRAVSRAT